MSPEEEISHTTRVIGDLGAESIDMLDIACELEKVMGLELDFHTLLQEHRAKGLPDDFTIQEILDFMKAQGTAAPSTDTSAAMPPPAVAPEAHSGPVPSMGAD